MRVLACGGRDYTDREHVFAVLDMVAQTGRVEVLIHGAARGADSLASLWALSRGVPEEAYPANWAAYPRLAGPIRNRTMLFEGKPDLVVAFPGGRGTEHMVRISRQAGVDVLEAKRSISPEFRRDFGPTGTLGDEVLDV